MTNDAEALARRFHETYERLAPKFGYETREASAVAWGDVPDANRALMIAVCAELLASRSALSGIPKTVCGETPWKKLAMQAMRYLNAEQIAEATKAAGANVTLCTEESPTGYHRPMSIDGVPRRNQMTMWTPAEKAIQEAVDVVESAGADVRLTDAVVLLGYARESVADFVDGVERRRLARVTDGLEVPASLSSSGSPRLSEHEHAIIEKIREHVAAEYEIGWPDAACLLGAFDRLSVASPEKGKDERTEFARAKHALEATGIAGIMDEFRDLPDAITQMAAHIADLTQQRDRAEGREPYNPIRPAGETIDAEDF